MFVFEVVLVMGKIVFDDECEDVLCVGFHGRPFGDVTIQKRSNVLN